jgi:hypothetical protein
MPSIDSCPDDLLARGRACFSRDEIAAALGLKPSALAAAIKRVIYKRPLAYPRHGFYLILRPEDQIAGAPMLPAAVRWSDADALQAFERVWTDLIARIGGDRWKFMMGPSGWDGLEGRADK